MKGNSKNGRALWALRRMKLGLPAVVLCCALFFLASFFGSVIPPADFSSGSPHRLRLNEVEEAGMPHGESGEDRVSALPFQAILPPGTNIPDAYTNGSTEDQAHIRVFESTAENRAALLMGLEYLIGISYVDDTEVFKVGGASKAEVGERKDRVTDALNAAKAAVEEGIVPGGGVALLYATRELEKIQTFNNDERRGVQIIENALKAPSFTIAANAGADASLVLGKLLEQDNFTFGYDASKGEYVDMVKAGIIDPLKVIRTALVDAASISVLLTTTEAAVVELEDTKSSPAMSRMPRMDGMDF